MTHRDLPAALELSTQAGWNQLDTDWIRLLSLCPEGCFGGWLNGELIASSTVLSYCGGPSWIGMVIVHDRHRLHGYGRRIFTHALAYARENGPFTVGLDATDMGRPLYLEQGFVDVAPITQWGGRLPRSRVPNYVALVDSKDLGQVVSYDRAACGWPRGTLLETILSESQAFGLVWRPAGNGVCGAAVVRPGRNAWQMGPVTTESPAGLEALLAAVAANLGPVEIIMDVLSESEVIHQTLRNWGLETRRHLVRMILGTSSELKASEKVVAAAGLELG